MRCEECCSTQAGDCKRCPAYICARCSHRFEEEEICTSCAIIAYARLHDTDLLEFWTRALQDRRATAAVQLGREADECSNCLRMPCVKPEWQSWLEVPVGQDKDFADGTYVRAWLHSQCQCTKRHHQLLKVLYEQMRRSGGFHPRERELADRLHNGAFLLLLHQIMMRRQRLRQQQQGTDCYRYNKALCFCSICLPLPALVGIQVPFPVISKEDFPAPWIFNKGLVFTLCVDCQRNLREAFHCPECSRWVCDQCIAIHPPYCRLRDSTSEEETAPHRCGDRTQHLQGKSPIP